VAGSWRPLLHSNRTADPDKPLRLGTCSKSYVTYRLRLFDGGLCMPVDLSSNLGNDNFACRPLDKSDPKLLLQASYPATQSRLGNT
jgi:hypothetical protein